MEHFFEEMDRDVEVFLDALDKVLNPEKQKP